MGNIPKEMQLSILHSEACKLLSKVAHLNLCCRSEWSCPACHQSYVIDAPRKTIQGKRSIQVQSLKSPHNPSLQHKDFFETADPVFSIRSFI